MFRIDAGLGKAWGAVAMDEGSRGLAKRAKANPGFFNALAVASNGRLLPNPGGVLIRVSRRSQELEPSLAVSWKVSEDGRRVDFQLRKGVKFSDGSSFDANDVAHTFRLLMDPEPSLEVQQVGSDTAPVRRRRRGPEGNVRECLQYSKDGVFGTHRGGCAESVFVSK